MFTTFFILTYEVSIPIMKSS